MKENSCVCKLHNYIFENFELSREARYLVINICNHIDRLPKLEQCLYAKELLLGAFGIEAEEIEKIFE